MAVHDAIISITGADRSICYTAVVTKLAKARHGMLHIIKDNLKRATGRGSSYLSISGAMAYDATISSIIEADPSIGYKALAIKLADMGMHVTLDI